MNSHSRNIVSPCRAAKALYTALAAFVLFSFLLSPLPLSAQRKAPAEGHDPNKALLLSIVPGVGQIYNRQAWKVPIIYAALGGIGYYSYSNYIQMKNYKDEYLYRVHHSDAALDEDLANTPTSNIYNLYQAYNKTFQLSVIITVAVYGLNLLDAYVFGHLFDFQITDDLSLDFTPAMVPAFNATGFGNTLSLTPTATITLRF